MNPGPETGSPEVERRVEDEPPPPGGSWNRLYLVVIGFLIIQIIAYWLFTKAFS